MRRPSISSEAFRIATLRSVSKPCTIHSLAVSSSGEGTFKSWDYKFGFSQANSDTRSTLAGGYSSQVDVGDPNAAGQSRDGQPVDCRGGGETAMGRRAITNGARSTVDHHRTMQEGSRPALAPCGSKFG